MVGDHKGVHEVVLLQIGIVIFELFDLLWIEDMDLPLEPAQAAIFPKCINQTAPVDGGGLQVDHHIAEIHGAKRRHDPL